MGTEPTLEQDRSGPTDSVQPGTPVLDWQSRMPQIHAAVGALVAELYARELSGTHRAVAARLRDCVLRPLDTLAASSDKAAVTLVDGGDQATIPEQLDERIWDLAVELLEVVACPDLPAAAGEAAAAMADLAWRGPQVPADADADARRDQLAQLVAEVEPRVVISADGPYLVTNVPEVVDWLGVPIDLAAQSALCRCGASAIKPLCDGSHARIGFSGASGEAANPDQRDTYPAPALTVLDNRALCSQSAFCTQRLRAVFHAGQAPFVTPSGGRMDEIVRAVRECPSGALSIAIDGREARETVDRADRPQRIEVSRDGPYRVTGGVCLLDDSYKDAARTDGASREHFSLCRCGQSRNMPFCSGRHIDVHFADPVPDRDRVPTLFEWAGGLPALTRLTRCFYETHVPADPVLGPLFAQMGPDHPERVAAWIAEVFGGPHVYSGNYGGFTNMMTRHLGRHFTEIQRARFVALLCRSADDVGMPADPEFRGAFVAYLEWGSRIAMETSQPGARPPRIMQMPLWGWIRDAVPGSRPPSFAEHEKLPAVITPEPNEPVRFAIHIRPLFRKMDRRAMSYVFDLWDVASVRAYAAAIMARIEEGTMPVDQPWSPEAVEVLRRWIASGMAD